MPIKNTAYTYGWISIVLHWSMALAVLALFALGYWMRGLSYYDEWYRLGPYIHKSVGILFAALLIFRLIWRFFNCQPKSADTLSTLEKRAAHLVHALLYILLLSIICSGYLISTADGRSIEVFTWFDIPAVLTDLDGQEDIAGTVHKYLAYSVIALAALHALAALKHHFIDKDNTLKKMLGTNPEETP